MTTTLQTRTSASIRNSGSAVDRFDLDPPPGGSGRTRWPEISIGVLIVAVFALGGAWFYSNASSPEAVLALRQSIDRGHVITSGDLVVVDIATEEAINTLSRPLAGTILGQIALTDLSAGTLVNPDLFASQAAIASGDGVVGLALDPGEFPSLALRAGDLVRVVETPRQGEDAAGDTVLAEMAEVADVAPIGVQGQLFISLAMTTSEADAVAAAGSQDRVRLIQIAGN